jgi:hypothetical protein
LSISSVGCCSQALLYRRLFGLSSENARYRGHLRKFAANRGEARYDYIIGDKFHNDCSEVKFISRVDSDNHRFSLEDNGQAKVLYYLDSFRHAELNRFSGEAISSIVLQ